MKLFNEEHGNVTPVNVVTRHKAKQDDVSLFPQLPPRTNKKKVRFDPVPQPIEEEDLLDPYIEPVKSEDKGETELDPEKPLKYIRDLYEQCGRDNARDMSSTPWDQKQEVDDVGEDEDSMSQNTEGSEESMPPNPDVHDDQPQPESTDPDLLNASEDETVIASDKLSAKGKHKNKVLKDMIKVKMRKIKICFGLK